MNGTIHRNLQSYREYTEKSAGKRRNVGKMGLRRELKGTQVVEKSKRERNALESRVFGPGLDEEKTDGSVKRRR